MIEEVENLRAEFKRARLTESEAFVDGEIAVDEARQPDRARARRIAEAAERRLRKGRRVEPALPCAFALVQIGFLPGTQVGARGSAHSRGVNVVGDRRRESALQGCDRR